MTSPCAIVDRLATFTAGGGAGGLVVLAGFKPVAGRREAAWVGSIPTRLRQKQWKQAVQQERGQWERQG